MKIITTTNITPAKRALNGTSQISLNLWSDYYFKLDSISTQHLSNLGLVTNNKISLAINSFKEMLINNISITSSLKLLIIFKMLIINFEIFPICKL
jgi:hypothetical protein